MLITLFKAKPKQKKKNEIWFKCVYSRKAVNLCRSTNCVETLTFYTRCFTVDVRLLFIFNRKSKKKNIFWSLLSMPMSDTWIDSYRFIWNWIFAFVRFFFFANTSQTHTHTHRMENEETRVKIANWMQRRRHGSWNQKESD